MTTALDYLGSGIKAATRSKAAEVLAKVAGAAGITHVWGYDPNKANTEHHTGNAVDFMVFSNNALGDRIYSYVWANRSRLGVIHILWEQSITSAMVEPGVRRRMADRGSTTENHMDHVHVLFTSKAYVKPGIVSKVVAKLKPKPKWDTSLRVGVRGSAVRSLQLGLNRVFPAYSRLRIDGDFGPATERVVKMFQSRSGLTSDGVVGPKTRSALAKVGVKF